MYTHDIAAVKIGNKSTSKYDVNQGVKQGCILSPLLFNIFLSDLPDFLNADKNDPVQITNQDKVGCIISADDLLLLSQSESGLNNMLDNLNGYSITNNIKINLDKTKCMIFNKTGRLMRRSFRLGENTIEMTCVKIPWISKN